MADLERADYIIQTLLFSEQIQVIFLSLKPNVIAGVEVRALTASLYLNIVIGAVLVP
jgi:hypothetical protein